jgi:hypothetical protein
MAAAPPALDVAANGQWIVKSTGSLASIQVTLRGLFDYHLVL